MGDIELVWITEGLGYTKARLLINYILSPKYGGHETSLDNAGGRLIGGWIYEVLLPIY